MKLQQNNEDIRLIYYDTTDRSPVFEDSTEAFNLMFPEWKQLEKELEFKILFLNWKFQLVTYCSLSKNGMSIVADYPEILFSTVPAYDSHSFILLHNVPFSEDNRNLVNRLTQEMLQAASIYGLLFMDHLVIMTYNKFSSLRGNKCNGSKPEGRILFPKLPIYYLGEKQKGIYMPELHGMDNLFMN